VDEDQFWKLYEKLPQHQQPVALLAYETGRRKKELLRLKWNQIDLKTRIVRLNPGETKNKDGRMFLYSDQMAEWFEVLPRVSEYVFTHRQKPLRNIRSGWDKAVEAVSGQSKPKTKKIKAPKGTLFHDLRRSAVRNMVRAGVPERVASISGHKNRSVFDRYNIISEADIRGAKERVSGYRSASNRAWTHQRIDNDFDASSATLLDVRVNLRILRVPQVPYRYMPQCYEQYDPYRRDDGDNDPVV